MLRRHCLAALAAAVLIPTAASAQGLNGQLATLLTEQRAPAPAGALDPFAAAATRQTLTRLFAVELSTLPTAASSAGFIYRLNPMLGVVERASNGFGPFFTERPLRSARGQASLGIAYQFASFTSLQGSDLQDGSFPSNAARITGAAQPFSVDRLQLDIDARMITAVATYGVTDRLAVGATAPITRVQFRGTRIRTADGLSALQSAQAGSASGLGDINLQARYTLVGGTVRGLAVGGDLKLPTGNPDNLLGSGKVAARLTGIASWEEGQLAAYVNAGIGGGGASNELFWSGATALALTPRVTLVGEVMGRRLSDLNLVRDVYQAHPQIAGIETMRWLPVERGVHTAFLVMGAKWNLGGAWLLSSNLLFSLTDAGLRATVTPAMSLDYAFAR